MSSLLHNQKHVDLQNIPLLFVYVCLYSETKINEIHRSQGRTSWKNRNVMARLATLSYLESANGHKGCFFWNMDRMHVFQPTMKLTCQCIPLSSGKKKTLVTPTHAGHPAIDGTQQQHPTPPPKSRPRPPAIGSENPNSYVLEQDRKKKKWHIKHRKIQRQKIEK